jgi:hypothetical protein
MNNKTLNSYIRLFDNAPIAAAILNKENLRIEMANPKMLMLWSRPASIIKLPLLDALPELADQRYPDYLKEVSHTRKPLEEKGAQVILSRSGKNQNVFMDYSYTPILNTYGKTTGILVLATDVCSRELDRLMARQSSLDLQALVLLAPIPMCIYRGPNFKIEVVNQHMRDIWQDTPQRNTAVLEHVFHNGIPFSITESGITYTYTSLGYGIEGNSGVCMVAARQKTG